MQTLLIDDDPTALFLTKRLFHREGLPEALTAFLSPVEALSFLQEQVVAGAIPQVILLDLNMPLLSGWGFLEAIRPLEAALLGRCSVYILTSSLAPDDAARAQDYRLVSGLIHKPLDSFMIQTIQAQTQGESPA